MQSFGRRMIISRLKRMRASSQASRYRSMCCCDQSACKSALFTRGTPRGSLFSRIEGVFALFTRLIRSGFLFGVKRTRIFTTSSPLMRILIAEIFAEHYVIRFYLAISNIYATCVYSTFMCVLREREREKEIKSYRIKI